MSLCRAFRTDASSSTRMTVPCRTPSHSLGGYRLTKSRRGKLDQRPTRSALPSDGFSMSGRRFEGRTEGAVSRPTRRQPAALVLAVAAAYALGAHVGFLLRFPPATTSLIWPPNALLTAILLMTPPRRWWLCLAAALPVHVAVELAAGF